MASLHLGKSRDHPRNLAEPRRTLEETIAEASKNPSEGQISSESLAEGCAPSDGDPPEL